MLAALEDASHNLLARENELGTIAAAAMDAIITADPNGDITFWNQAAETMFGYSAAEALGRNVHELLAPARYAEQAAAALARFEETNYAMEPGRVRAFWAQRKDRSEIPVEISLSALQTRHGRGSVAIVRDVSAREQAERLRHESESRLKVILESVQAGIVLIDVETHVVADINPAALALLGAQREAVVGRVCHNYICPDSQGACPITDLNQTVDCSERSLLRSDGTAVPILKTIKLVTLEGRRYMLESFVSIAAQKQAEQALRDHREQLERIIQERTQSLVDAQCQLLQGEKLASIGRLAAGVAHEINTPIQYVGDNLRALADFYTDIKAVVEQYRALVAELAPASADRVRNAEQEHDLEFILEDGPKAIEQGLEGVQRVATIVRAMRDFSHVRTGTSSLTDLNHCLESTLTVARNEYKYVADIETHFGEIPQVECYASELNQVFLNMLVNAAHAIQDTERRGTITIATTQVDDGVEVSITDTGTGIPEDIRDKIMAPFFTTKEVGRGTGQGLHLAQQVVVVMHGGTLTFDSTVGVGTTFRIRLPLRLPPQRAKEDTPEQLVGATAE
jgi:two-component system, NtrC family, sensor kinase